MVQLAIPRRVPDVVHQQQPQRRVVDSTSLRAAAPVSSLPSIKLLQLPNVPRGWGIWAAVSDINNGIITASSRRLWAATHGARITAHKETPATITGRIGTAWFRQLIEKLFPQRLPGKTIVARKAIVAKKSA